MFSALDNIFEKLQTLTKQTLHSNKKSYVNVFTKLYFGVGILIRYVLQLPIISSRNTIEIFSCEKNAFKFLRNEAVQVLRHHSELDKKNFFHCIV